MYTQCPDCEIAFKVTADVLKQAAGKVRCGGCGNAFNALAYLSEQLPEQPETKQADSPVPELKPELTETDGGLPKKISARQSAALLKTLDELAGSDIRIEDTGVEWRVLDEQDAAMPAADDDDAGPNNMLEIVDELLADDPTPVDEVLTTAPEVDDSPEVFAAARPTKNYVDELRFDDNTPLPDNFDLDGAASYLQHDDADTAERVELPEPEPEPEIEQSPDDIALSEPDEWTDILGEFQDLVDEVTAPVEIDDASGEPTKAPAQELAPEELASDEIPGSLEGSTAGDQPMNMDAQFALQAEAMGIDISGINELPDELAFSESAVFEDRLSAEPDEGAQQAVEPEEAEQAHPEEVQKELDLDAPGAGLEQAEKNPKEDDETEEEPENAVTELDEVISQIAVADDSVIADETPIEEPMVENHSIEEELAGIGENDGPGDHYVPPMTEEEHTVNMQIDQELMALAIEDQDGFASTIVIPGRETESKALEELDDSDDDETDNSVLPDPIEVPVGIESIVMEGEVVRSALDKEKLAADTAAAAKLAELARARDVDAGSQSSGKRFGIIAGIVALALLFVAQFVHQSRDSLATIPAFSNTVGQLYRALGQPLQPAWDVAGWRIEASSDQLEVQEGEENLTVSSRIGNNASQAMPYPLVNISLTDRFLEPVGSQLLDPSEYLPTDLDPRKLLEPGDTFNAIITIKSPSMEASGYKIDVCYRQTDGRLRCAIDDFK